MSIIFLSSLDFSQMILTQAKQGTQERGAYLLGLWVRQSALQRAQLRERERAA